MTIMYLLVTIDTEEDMPKWQPEPTPTLKNITRLPLLQETLSKYGIRPTYLVNRPVIHDTSACNIIKKLADNDNCEIGMHLHSWNTPPVSDEEARGKATYLHSLPTDLQREKLTRLNNDFKKKLGLKPTSYRAGRYGFSIESARLLCELDFEVDSSIVPLKNYSQDGGPDFRKYDLHPFFIKDSSNYSPLLEVPLTVDLVHCIPGLNLKRYFSIPQWTHLRGLLHKLNLAKIINLRPTTFSLRDMRQLVKHVLAKTSCPVLNIMFHSSECFPGTSLYHHTEKDVSRFLHRFFQIIEYVIYDHGLKGVTLTEFFRLTRRGTLNNMVPLKNMEE